MATITRTPKPHTPRSAAAIRARYGLGQLLVYVGLMLGLSFTLTPFLWMIFSSLKVASEIIHVPPTFFPQNPTLNNYATILQDPRLPLARFYFNSGFITVCNVLSSLFTSSLLGYVFAKFEFRGKRFFFGYFLISMMIPFQMTMIPGYLILVKLGLINNLWGLILTSFLNGFGIFLMRQFAETLPNELLDAGRIDGASEWQIYWRIVLPQLGPSLATLGTLTFMSNWNAYLWPMVILRGNNRTLPVILTWYSTQHGTRPQITMAATVMVVMPILVVYFFFQRWIVRGITMTGFK